MILGVGHWQRLWPCSSLSDAARNVRTCASRPSGIRATNRESGEWMSGGGQQLHASHRYNTASSASSAASASPAAFRDGRTDRLLPCDISVGVCPGILSRLMPYHAGLFHEGVGLGFLGSGSVWVGLEWQPRGAGSRVAAVSIARQPPLSHVKIFPERPLSATKTPLLGCSIATLRSLQAFSVGYAAYWATYAGTVTARAPVIPQLQPPFECQECFHVSPCASICASICASMCLP